MYKINKDTINSITHHSPIIGEPNAQPLHPWDTTSNHKLNVTTSNLPGSIVGTDTITAVISVVATAGWSRLL